MFENDLGKLITDIKIYCKRSTFKKPTNEELVTDLIANLDNAASKNKDIASTLFIRLVNKKENLSPDVQNKIDYYIEEQFNNSNLIYLTQEYCLVPYKISPGINAYNDLENMYNSPVMPYINVFPDKNTALCKKQYELSKDQKYRQFNTDQKLFLLYAYSQEVNIKPIVDYNYTKGQMKQLLYGIIDDLNISAYSSPEYDWKTMSKIRRSLIEQKNNSLTQSTELPRIFIDMNTVLTESTKISSISEIYKPGYFKNLQPKLNNIKTINNIINKGNIDTYICCNIVDSKYAKNEVSEWISNYLPQIDKSHQIIQRCIDDNKKYIIDDLKDNDYLLTDENSSFQLTNLFNSNQVQTIDNLNQIDKNYSIRTVNFNRIKDSNKSNSLSLNNKDYETVK